MPFLRNQEQKPEGEANLCLSDFIAPANSGINDWIGCFAVTSGTTSALIEDYKRDGNEFAAIMIQILADRLAEAFAEWLHLKIRKDFWGYSPNESLTVEQLLQEKYVGIRPAPGYPACPDHRGKQWIFQLLDIPRNASISLTDNMAMNPLASVAGFYLASSASKYFNVGKIDIDQLADYAKRIGVSITEAARLFPTFLANQ